MKNKNGIIALSPLIVFILLYLVTSIIAQDFYKVPISVAFLISGIYAIMSSPHGSLSERIRTFSRGASTENIMLMIWIFMLAGAFANTAKDIGCVDATVNLMLSVLPDNMILAGLFISTCFISLSIGTSVGAIVALAPIAIGLAQTTGTNMPMMLAIIVGGAFFGDNLSFISDTTVAATSSQECSMKDKFKMNSYIVFPVAFIILILYVILGFNIKTPTDIPQVEFSKILPYLAVFITALMGVNVIIVLTIGLILTAIIGIINGSYDIFGWFTSMGVGLQSMSELIIITMIAGGLFEIVCKNGGIEYIIGKISSHIHSKRGAELVIGIMVATVNICTANNTVAIITVGGIARTISLKYGVDNRKAASILDTFSCCIQGIIPYGAQILTVANLSKTNPIDIMPYLYYPYALGLFTLLCIYFGFPASHYKK